MIMKQKNNSSELVTKDYFKKELNGTINRLLQGIHREITFAMETVEEKFDRKLTENTSLILTTVDPLLKELEIRREDREIASNQSAGIKDRIDNHEKRIKILESA
jgi:hypothetical protein